jgi:hypothetical protein
VDFLHKFVCWNSNKNKFSFIVFIPWSRTNHLIKLKKTNDQKMITESIVSEYLNTCGKNFWLTNLFTLVLGIILSRAFFLRLFFLSVSLYGKKWDKKRMDNQEDSTIKTIEPRRSFVEVHKFLMAWTSQPWVIILLRGCL